MLEERVTAMWWYPSRPKSSDHGRLNILVMTLSRTMGQRINSSEEADWMLTIISDYLTLALVQDEISRIAFDFLLTTPMLKKEISEHLAPSLRLTLCSSSIPALLAIWCALTCGLVYTTTLLSPPPHPHLHPPLPPPSNKMLQY